ncbi:MAG TPA: GxxExxY protein [Patescibacteria group bacterium]|nr:GxxExxY protein [Patescibacteria group bacterium]
MEKDKLLYRQESYLIRGACFEVWKKFGGAFKEKVIDNSLQISLRKKELKLETQKRIDIYFDEIKVGTYIPDIIVNEKIIIELKCKPFLTKGDIDQFWKYLKGSQYKLGFLINFGSEKLEIKRVVYETARNNKQYNISA